ncbi:hypothetical protein LXN10_05575 [Arcobacter sp. KX21116]|uniref:hypothetical protein n=1 Tax=Arcobacter iocasae TaxID=2906515 RepID=UPI0035D3E89C
MKDKEEKIFKLKQTIKDQKRTIRLLEKKISTYDEKFISQEISKSIFHHNQAINHRVDQFLFDAKILIEKDSELLKKVKKLKF